MAVKNMNKNLSKMKIIIREDSAIPEDLTDEEWKNYSDTLDESFLRLTDIPTRFVLVKSLNFAAQKIVQNSQMNINQDGQAQMQLGYILDEIRCALVDIENPDSIPEEEQIKFIKEIDGFCSKELIAQLNSAGYIMQLFSIRTNIIAKYNKEQLPKKK